MKKLFLLFCMLLSLPLASRAQGDEDTAERARIAAERGQAEAAFRAEEKDCYRRFAVNDCLSAARDHRRQLLADLRRQEISLNDSQRKRKAAEHLRDIEQRSLPEKQEQKAEQRAKTPAEQPDRAATAARKAADRTSSEASLPAKAARRQEEVKSKQADAAAARKRRAEEAARNLEERQKRLAEAQERKANADKRLAERKKPPAKPLPVPE
jgi:colicin import membrane protein